MTPFSQRKRALLSEYNSPPLQGFHVRRTPRGFTIIEIDFTADENKRNPQWEEAIRRQYASVKEFRREFKRDWKSASGNAFYPEFEHNGEVDFYVKTSPGQLSSQPVLRGWDFGYQRPACVWAQYSPNQHLLWVVREIMPEYIDVGDFADLVLYLSGSLPYDRLGVRAKTWAGVIGSNAGGPASQYPPPPWFPLGTHFMDYAGPEALRTSDMPMQESQDRTRAQVLASKGITLAVHGMSVKAREEALRSLLRPREDIPRPGSRSSLYFDPACQILIDGFNGGIAFPKETQANPLPDQPHKDGFYEHLHDALGYLVVGYVPMLRPVLEAQVSLFAGT